MDSLLNPAIKNMGKPKHRSWTLTACLMLCLFGPAAPWEAAAEVFVVANRSVDAIQMTLTDALGHDRVLRAASGGVLSVPLDSEGQLAIDSGAKNSPFAVEPYAVYFVHGHARRGYVLEQIGLPSVPRVHGSRRADIDTGLSGGNGSGSGESARRSPDSDVTIKVKILGDEEIVASYRDWADRLKQRVAAASRVLSEHCGLRLQVVEVGTWRSDNSQTDFGKTLRDFERQVPLTSGQVAIGFTGQYRRPAGRTKLGGIRGPLHPHILIREWPRHVSERERLELLVHELGHYLGAVHSPESDSVMRPILADRQAMYRQFQVRFDPINTLVIYLVAQGLRSGRMDGLDALSQQTKLVLRGVYTDVGRAMPDDPTPPKYVGLLNLPGVAARRTLLPTPSRNRAQRRLLPVQTPRTSGGR